MLGSLGGRRRRLTALKQITQLLDLPFNRIGGRFHGFERAVILLDRIRPIEGGSKVGFHVGIHRGGVQRNGAIEEGRRLSSIKFRHRPKYENRGKNEIKSKPNKKQEENNRKTSK